MKISKLRIVLILTILLVMSSFLSARSVDGGGADKKFDLIKYHNVGNIWLRVSNYGFFGSGDDITPQWPSLEYPGGSGIDYLYQGALWFGAKKVRRNTFGEKLYWVEDPEDENDVIPESDDAWDETLSVAMDTLVTVGFDGDGDLYEFLPAYNPLETSALGTQYSLYNVTDTIMTASIRSQRRGVDDDGDGLVDEDPVGYAFPLRDLHSIVVNEVEVFGNLSNIFLDEATPSDIAAIYANAEIWFPLGFVDLSSNENEDFNFSMVTDDDGDGLDDEDGYPISEQDYISYYYDYSPFGTVGERHWGSASSRNDHFPLNVRVRQLSYQWSYEYIKNLVYIEFNITNMNPVDDLFDCAMGIYMDSDVGPQPWGGQEKAGDDVSSFVSGDGYNFAYTFDADFDGGLSTGYVGSRVCTPDPEQLEFACWTWQVGNGPDDEDPRDLNPTSGYANEKYWLLTHSTAPFTNDYVSLKDFPDTQAETPVDTRYLFGFYGAQAHTGDQDDDGDEGFGIDDYLETDVNGNYTKRWDLAPGETMKIVVAVFPGSTINELKQQSVWAKTIYGQAQTLTTVVEPDLFPHYEAPEPPKIPKVYAELIDRNGSNKVNRIQLFWENQSEMENIDTKTVNNEDMGWQDLYPGLDSHIDNYDPATFPSQYTPPASSSDYNFNATINPWTAYRLRHDFQGYALWGRSGSGSQEDWTLMERWDKYETDQDIADYNINSGSADFLDFGGNLGIDTGLPNQHTATEADLAYYRYNGDYDLVNFELDDIVSGNHIYNAEVDYTEELAAELASMSFNDQALAFKHPDMRADVYLAIYDDKLIPLLDHSGQSAIPTPENPGLEALESLRLNRGSRRSYNQWINNPPKGIEYYCAVTSWDRGIPKVNLQSLESGKDGNMKVFFPGTLARDNMDDIHVVPNPYIGQSKFDGRRQNDDKGDKSRRLWFVNLPEKCTIKIFTLAGDLVDTIHHNGAESEDIITVSKAAQNGIKASGMASWDILSKNDQIIAPGVYLYSVIDKDDNKKVGKFVIIK